MKSTVTLLALAAISVVGTGCADLSRSPGAASNGVSAERLSQHVKIIAGDDYEGRAPATRAEAKTVAYLVDQFTKAGVQPGGTLGSDGRRGWTQDVPLGRFEIVGPITVGVTVGGKTAALQQGRDVAIRAAMTNADRVQISNAPIVFIGYGVTAPERRWDDFKGIDLKGKVVMVLVNDPDFETGVGDFGGKAMTYYGRWTYKYEEAARRGAAGVLIVHETAPAAYGWATVKNSNTNEQFDIVRQQPSAAHVPMEAWIQHDAAVDILRRAGLDYDTLKRQAQTREFQPITLAGTSFAADFAVDHRVITSKNVIGLLPGTGHPDETVMYSAHWDHLGIGLPDARGDTIYNGAVDNATGTAALLELARVHAAAPRTDRSVVFLSVTAEEKGLLGSAYYATHPVYPTATTVAVLNMDALGVNGPARDMTTAGSGQTTLQDDLARALQAEGRVYSPDPRPESGSFFRSDHFEFAKVGVPAISIGSGTDLVDGGKAAGLAARAAYSKDKYHQPADEWSASWNLTGQVQDLNLLYRLGRDLAQSRQWPRWYDNSEFKAARTPTDAERR